MAKTKPKVGDKMIHHGHLHELVEFSARGALDEKGEPVKVEMAVFENGSYKGICKLEELVWSEADQAWYLPGRVLANDERMIYAAMFGNWPPAEIHLTARRMLDELDLDAVDVEKVKAVALNRGRYRRWQADGKLNAAKIEQKVAAEGKAPTDDQKAYRERMLARLSATVDDYAVAAIEHCRELRAIRPYSVKEG